MFSEIKKIYSWTDSVELDLNITLNVDFPESLRILCLSDSVSWKESFS